MRGLVESEKSQESEGLTRLELANRLKVSGDTITRYRKRKDFAQWSRKYDPEGIGWQLKNNLYYPIS